MLSAIDNGDTSKAGQLLIDATLTKTRAGLFMEGHNPQRGPSPDGLGGFDVGDPIFSDGFESGDVSAWSTGDPVNVTPPGVPVERIHTIARSDDSRY